MPKKKTLLLSGDDVKNLESKELALVMATSAYISDLSRKLEVSTDDMEVTIRFSEDKVLSFRLVDQERGDTE